MALTKYIKRPAAVNNTRVYIDGELRSIQLSVDSIIEILKALNVPIEIGPADSAGIGFRTLRIPN